MAYMALFILCCVFLSYISRRTKPSSRLERKKDMEVEEDRNLLGNFLDLENRKDK